MATNSPHEHQVKLLAAIAPYQQSELRRSLWQLVNTVLPFLALWVGAYLSFSVSVWITLALTIPAAGFLVRIFIIFHDCVHHSFFKSRRANEWVGIVTGLFSFFPFQQWKYEHNVHHAANGNLNRRGTGDIWTLTADEYRARSPLQRMIYRMYRHPVVMFGLGPILVVLFRYRVNRAGAGRRERLNTHLTTAILVAVMTLLCWTLGWRQVLLVEGPILYMAGMAGIWLFYVQHQFEHSYFERSEKWDYIDAALSGSSFYRLPKVLQWITGNIGFHHIHHLGPRVPNYRLQRLHDSLPELQQVAGVGLLASFRSLRSRLWDEETGTFVGFRSVRRRSR